MCKGISAVLRLWPLAVIMAAIALLLYVMLNLLVNVTTMRRNREASEDMMFTTIALLNHDAIRKIRVYSRFYETRRPLIEISDAEELRRFVSSFQKATRWLPQHPRCHRQLYVTVELHSNVTLEYEFCLQDDNAVYVHFVRKGGNGLSYFGHARSEALYAWLEATGILSSRPSPQDANASPARPTRPTTPAPTIP